MSAADWGDLKLIGFMLLGYGMGLLSRQLHWRKSRKDDDECR